MILLQRLILLCALGFCLMANAADITPAKGAIVKRIEWSNQEMEKRFKGYFKEVVKRPYDALTLKIQTDLISKELFTGGYFNSVIKTELGGTENELIVKITMDLKDRINFEFQGNHIFSHQELRTKLLDKIRNEFGKVDVKNLASFLADEYEDAGFYQTKVTNYQSEGVDASKLKVINYFFVIDEGFKIKVSDISYRGNSFLKNEEINDIFKSHATALAKGGFYDKSFFDEFSDILKKEYLSRGFVFIEVSRPRVVSNDEDDSVTIEYGIAEKQQVILKNITFAKVPDDLAAQAKTALINKEGSPVNIIELENDLRKMIVYFQNEGYYFANITNLNSDTLLVYEKSYASVDLRPEINLDKKICYNEAIINGNVQTNTRVINREIDLKQGDLITPKKLEDLRQRLSGLNLFSSLRITPYMMYESEATSCPKTNLVIQVKEKDFGLIEVAPGYRTDLGAKLSTGVTYNNISGMNRSASLRLQGNKRFNLDGFDERRKSENKDLFEYSAKASFVEPYVFYNMIKTQLEFELSSTFQRIRFYGFDADIFRISPQISKNFTRTFSSSVKYQFERIVQFDATETKDNDNFSIGGITPTVTWDLRDDAINPRKGAFFTLSSEWANNFFGSMKEKELEVNFVKVISRNRFYYPMGDFVVALSIAAGYQKNFAEEKLVDNNGNTVLNANGQPKTRGYIPSIKVFRLDGYDEIRGYDEGEINRLIDGTPIGEVIVQREAYFTALKFEPRYNLTDAIKIGIFFDAGRVYVDDFQPMKLRTSVGAGLKYVTPVGSLDFDYGFKLQRKTYPDQQRDSVGRFHLSIGFF
ncbi:BamA/TamA family outer membrane protein [Bacteriovorax sp. PP10]|uniref:BamA/TamA family outer membrane protein n=1 Tax=Bacteriovorax antarcticus TaxID=3088717 RepID=A0ABU5VNN9_9BACT|nr:BamA/TamA family outer membrane protein [Bacteriovorax sp. PP10]MEA9354651.1 BamA/TamA family outer membrane protein [Bacteriovorax sp. PP10]